MRETILVGQAVSRLNRIIVFLFLLALFPVTVSGQEIKLYHGPELSKMRNALERLRPHIPKELKGIAVNVLDSDIVNASAVTDTKGHRAILLTKGILQLMDEGELAWILGHELGHHYYKYHDLSPQKFPVYKDHRYYGSPPGQALVPSPPFWQHEEVFADIFGLTLLRCTGINVFEAGAAMGKFMLFQGRADWIKKLFHVLSGEEHPMNEDRIDYLRAALIKSPLQCQGS